MPVLREADFLAREVGRDFGRWATQLAGPDERSGKDTARAVGRSGDEPHRLDGEIGVFGLLLEQEACRGRCRGGVCRRHVLSRQTMLRRADRAVAETDLQPFESRQSNRPAIDTQQAVLLDPRRLDGRTDGLGDDDRRFARPGLRRRRDEDERNVMLGPSLRRGDVKAQRHVARGKRRDDRRKDEPVRRVRGGGPDQERKIRLGKAKACAPEARGAELKVDPFDSSGRADPANAIDAPARRQRRARTGPNHRNLQRWWQRPARRRKAACQSACRPRVSRASWPARYGRDHPRRVGRRGRGCGT